jgi:hypothetical protein
MLPRATPMAQPLAPIACSSIQSRHRDVRHLRRQHVEPCRGIAIRITRPKHEIFDGGGSCFPAD